MSHATKFREQRRAIVASDPKLRGIERVSLEQSSDGWILELLFIRSEFEGKSSVPPKLGPGQLLISRRDGPPDRRLRVLSVARDDRTARLRLEVPPGTDEKFEGAIEVVGLDNIDPFFAGADFPHSPPDPDENTDVFASVEELIDSSKINYLARDYETFRQLMLDRMSEFIPEWEERNPADLGVAMVEVLAYAADYLSYHQDSIAAEAYLGTARRRVSVGRHVRLLDYVMHQGCNSRTWICVEMPDGAPGFELPAGSQFMTAMSETHRGSDGGGVIARGSQAYDQAIVSGVQVFESAYPVRIEAAKQALALYTWGAEDFSLFRGATSATLIGTPELVKGDLVVFSKTGRSLELSDRTDLEIDARSAGMRSHVVRLCASPQTGFDVAAAGVSLTEISWYPEDALPFELRVSRRIGSETFSDLAEAGGNLVLADHGRTLTASLPPVPETGVFEPTISVMEELTHRVDIDFDEIRERPASWAVRQDPREGLPAIQLEELPYEIGNTEQHTAYPHRAATAAGLVAIQIGESSQAGLVLAENVAAVFNETHTVASETRAAGAEAKREGQELEVALCGARDTEDPALLDAIEKARAAAKAAEEAEQAAQGAAAAAEAAAVFGAPGKIDSGRPETAIAAQRAADDAKAAAARAAKAASDAAFAAGAAKVAARIAIGDGGDSTAIWRPRRDLVDCGPFDRVFVVQWEGGGDVSLRFGDGVNGRKPCSGTRFRAVYRIGNGPVGNLGADTIKQFVSSGVSAVYNPVPAVGGRAAEELERARRIAPAAVRRERRCITPDDYATAGKRYPGVLDAAARLRWTGSWKTAFVHVQRPAGRAVDAEFETALTDFLDPFLPIGTDLKVVEPRWVPLEIHLTVTVAQGFLSKSVHQRLKSRLGSAVSSEGERGLFEPDAWGFGKPVHLAALVAAAREVQGVAAIVADRFERKGAVGGLELTVGEIKIGPLEIATLRPSLGGSFRIALRGGL